jgi:thioredoxin 1
MNARFTMLLASALLGASLYAEASPASGSYDESANADADIRQALVEASRKKTQVLVVFGANWCGDCRMLDTSFKTGEVAPLIRERYQVVKVNVGRFNVNTDIAERYGVPLKKGIPAVAVLNAQGQAQFVTAGGELANARKMGDAGVLTYFSTLPQP